MAYQFTGRSDEAEELTQEIFLHLLSALDNFDASGSLPAWIQRVARNYAIDYYRHRRRERALVVGGEDYEEAVRLTGAPRKDTDPHHSLEQKDIASWLRAVIDELPTELAHAVILRDLQDMSYDEIAEVLEVPLGTVKSRINRGRLELARRLKRKQAAGSRRLPRPRGGPS